MQVQQFEDKNLSHYSYAILVGSEKKIVLIDPARNPEPYYNFAKESGAEIAAVIETHPHADFVSSHLELHYATGATIYASKLVNGLYPYTAFDEGDFIQIGNIRLSSINTPGHSPDSICVVLEEDDVQKMIFTGDTLFIGDCGRPDLREGSGSMQLSRQELASAMYHSLRDKLMPLGNDLLVYPAHGAGTLCGKALSKANSSTIGAEKLSNWALQKQTEEEFVAELLADQPFVPAYFPFDVEINRKGAAAFRTSLAGGIETVATKEVDLRHVVVDARKGAEFRSGHLANSINIIEGGKFETWLGSIIKPGEVFYLGVTDTTQALRLIERCASIGYEGQVKGTVITSSGRVKEKDIVLDDFKAHTQNYTIVDVRNPAEVKQEKKFINSIAIPLGELKDRVSELPTEKPIVVHCAGGTRSAAGSSIIKAELKDKVEVFDLGEAVKEF